MHLYYITVIQFKQEHKNMTEQIIITLKITRIENIDICIRFFRKRKKTSRYYIQYVYYIADIKLNSISLDDV